MLSEPSSVRVEFNRLMHRLIARTTKIVIIADEFMVRLMHRLIARTTKIFIIADGFMVSNRSEGSILKSI